MQNLGTFAGGETGLSQALDISGAGGVIIGRSASTVGTQAFRWEDSGGMVGLGFLIGDSYSSASAANGDGSIVVGESAASSVAAGRAFIWNSSGGMRDLQGVLSTEYGLAGALAGWQLQSATGISDDGYTFAGTGLHNGVTEGWIATVPEPGSCGLIALGALLLGVRRKRHPRPA